MSFWVTPGYLAPQNPDSAKFCLSCSICDRLWDIYYRVVGLVAKDGGIMLVF
jgi:hypothetical protein